jgi:hypothetical protein
MRERVVREEGSKEDKPEPFVLGFLSPSKDF